MELYQLSSFVTIARIGNMTRAAAAMHISLSALSSQITLLEDEMGFPLFTRKPRGMELTGKGKALLEYASRALHAADEVKRQALRMREEYVGTLCLGMNTDPGFLKITSLNREFATALPRVEMTYTPTQTLQTVELLRAGTIDLGFSYDTLSGKGITSVPLIMVPIRIVIPYSLLPDAEHATWEDLSNLTWMWGTCDCPFHRHLEKQIEHYLPPKKMINAVDESVVMELVQAGQGVGVMRQGYADQLAAEGIAHIWEQDYAIIPLCINTLSERESDPLIQATLNLIKGVFFTPDQQVSLSIPRNTKRHADTPPLQKPESLGV